jgi:hypothetical protein
VSRRSGRIACILAALALVASCGGADDAAEEDSGVEGVALVGPTCPVERDPPDPECDDRPLAEATVRAQQGDRVVGETETDAQGRFRLPLAPGDYQLFTSGGIAPFAVPAETARVVANRFTQVELQVDSGIR